MQMDDARTLADPLCDCAAPHKDYSSEQESGIRAVVMT
jgi:hypothetical protein